MARPPDIARTYSLDEKQWRAWEELQRSALRFGGSFLTRMMRTNEAKDLFFLDAIAFVRSFEAPQPIVVKRAGKRRGRKRA